MSSRRDSDFARLEQLLREANAKAEQAQRAQQEAEKSVQHTTFDEFLQACHNLLFKPLTIRFKLTHANQPKVPLQIPRIDPVQVF